MKLDPPLPLAFRKIFLIFQEFLFLREKYKLCTRLSFCINSRERRKSSSGVVWACRVTKRCRLTLIRIRNVGSTTMVKNCLVRQFEDRNGQEKIDGVAI